MQQMRSHEFNMGSDATSSQVSLLPHMHILCMEREAAAAWHAAMEHYKLNSSLHVQYTIHDCALSQLSSKLHFDAVISPANSYAILDGGFDDAISRAFSPKDDYAALTHHAQAYLYTTDHGYLPPGQCRIVHLPGEWREEKRLRYHDGTGWGVRYLVLLPTMRMPSRCDWDRELVYECVWSMLNNIERHNDSVADGKGGEEAGRGSNIRSLLMTPLGTGTGFISYERWARQAALAIKHWLESTENPEKWMRRDWRDLARIEAEIKLTHEI